MEWGIIYKCEMFHYTYYTNYAGFYCELLLVFQNKSFETQLGLAQVLLFLLQQVFFQKNPMIHNIQ